MLKYEIRCFTIKFSKDLARAKKSKQYLLENKLKFLESNLNCDINSAEYINCKNQLEEIYANGYTKVFLNLEKTKATQGTVKKLEIDNKEIDNFVEINKELEKFFENLFKRKLRKTKHEFNEFLRDISLPTLSKEQKKVCDEEISEQEVVLALKSFSNNKSAGNDGLTKEFYGTFWEELKQPFMNSLNQAKVSKKLVTSQRQAVIKLLEKKDKDKRLISIWRPISLLNVDYKIIYYQIEKSTSKSCLISTNCLCCTKEY